MNTKAKKVQKNDNKFLWYGYFALIILSIIIYTSSLFYNLTGCDDKLLIMYTSNFQKDGSIIESVFEKPYMYQDGLFYRPVVELSIAADYLIDNSSVIFHAANLVYHLIASCLVFTLFLTLKIRKEISLFLAAVFTVHPLVTGVVSWIPGRNDSLLCIFIITSFIFFIKYFSGKNLYFLILHFIFFIFALLTKETAVFLPLMCIFYFYLVLRQEKITVTNKSIFMIAAWAGILIIWYIVRNSVVKTGFTFDFFKNLPFVVQSAGKILLPFNLSVLPVIRDTSFIPGVISFLIIILLLIFTKNKNYRLIIFSFCWFFIFLVPSLFNINPEYSSDLMLEPRLYLPSIGIFIFLSQISLLKNFAFNKLIFALSAIIIIAGFSLLSYNYAKYYKDEESFWRNAVENSPGLDLSHSGLGLIYLQKEKYDLSVIQYKKAVEINPSKRGYNGKIAFILTKQNKTDEAEKYYKRELELNPSDKDANLIMGVISFKKNELEQAEKYFLVCKKQNPEDIQPAYYLMKVYYQEGNLSEAAKYAKQLKGKGVKLPENIVKDLHIE